MLGFEKIQSGHKFFKDKKFIKKKNPSKGGPVTTLASM